jgi:hypothetical protein
MDGKLTPDTIATILSLITSRTHKGGFVPWMFQLSWDWTLKCMTWQISYESMESAVTSGLLTSYLMGESAVQYSVGDGGNIVEVILIVSTCT